MSRACSLIFATSGNLCIQIGEKSYFLLLGIVRVHRIKGVSELLTQQNTGTMSEKRAKIRSGHA